MRRRSYSGRKPTSCLLLGVLLRAFVFFDLLAEDLAVAGVHDDLAEPPGGTPGGSAHDHLTLE